MTTHQIGSAPFIAADHAEVTSTGATVTYTYGVNNSGTHQDEVLMQVQDSTGDVATYVILRGISRAKAQAIAMILNAPEG